MLLFNILDKLYYLKLNNFNTSNVTIQPSTSVCLLHRMNDFNTSNVTIQHKHNKQKVRSYFISIHLMLLFNLQCIKALSSRYNFNTSNVTIQLSFSAFSCAALSSFNTSNVTIQLDCITVSIV